MLGHGTFDIRGEAESMSASTKGQPVLLAMALVVLPSSVGILVSRTGFWFGIYGIRSLGLFAIGALIAAYPSYLLYRSQTDLGPVSLTLAQRKLDLRYSDGRVIRWELERLRSMLLMTVTAPDGVPPVWTVRTDANKVPVPFLQKWPASRIAVSNGAATAVRNELLRLGWTEKVENSEGELYRATKSQLRAPPY
jgi:hypothetical protein